MLQIQIAIVLVLIIANGLLAMSELAVVSARTSRLQERADKGSSGARIALELAADPNRFLSSVQIGITLIGVLSGAFGGATLSRPVADGLENLGVPESTAGEIAVVLVVVCITYFSLVIGELVPKQLALQRAESLAVMMAPWLLWLARITSPVVSVLAVSSSAVLKLLRADQVPAAEVTEAEIRDLIRQGTEVGVLDVSESAIVSEVFKLADRNVGELMTPRRDIHYLDLSRSDEDNRAEMIEHPHSWYPVADGGLDNVVGVVASQELWHRTLTGASTSIRDALQPALFVPQLAPAFDVTEQMRRERAHLAMIIDEYGGTDGLITFNDLLSDIIGEMDGSHPDQIKGVQQRADGSWLVDGSVPAHELMELLNIAELPGETEGRFETAAGFLMDQLGRIPDTGDVVAWSHFTFEVLDMDGNRVDKLLVSINQQGTHVSPEIAK